MRPARKHIVRKHLERLRAVKRSRYHPLVHKIHRKHRISRRTLFYVKEYGPQSNVPRTIIKESIKILLLASLISSFGGLALERVRVVLLAVIPLVVLLPTLNSMIGSYGTVFSSRISTMLYLGRIHRPWSRNRELRKLFVQIVIIAVVIAVLSSLAALGVSTFSRQPVSAVTAFKILVIALLDIALLVTVVFFISLFAGVYFYRKGEDPNNFLIPITTSVADFGNMVILSGLVLLFF